MKNNTLLLVGAVVAGYFVYDAYKKKNRTASLETDAEMANCSGCSNAEGDPNYTPCADAGLSAEECQRRCKGVYNANENECESGFVAPTRSVLRTRSYASANGGW